MCTQRQVKCCETIQSHSHLHRPPASYQDQINLGCIPGNRKHAYSLLLFVHILIHTPIMHISYSHMYTHADADQPKDIKLADKVECSSDEPAHDPQDDIKLADKAPAHDPQDDMKSAVKEDDIKLADKAVCKFIYLFIYLFI